MTSDFHIREIAPPVDLPMSVLGFVLLGGVAVIILADAVYYYAHLRAASGLRVFSVPPDEIALQALDGLLGEGLLEQGELKTFHQRLTDILREYIRDQLGLDAQGQTTREFLARLSTGTAVEPVHQALLRTLLTRCDLVKFAEYEPSAAETRDTVESCQTFILETAYAV